MTGLSGRFILRQVRRCLRESERNLSISAKPSVKNDYTVRSTLADIAIQDTSLNERMWRDLDGFKNRTAIECAETHKKYTYEELLANMARFATSLRSKFGLKNHDTIAVMLPNIPEYAVIVFGSLQAGCIVTGINPVYKEHELIHQFTLTQPKVVVTNAACYQIILKSLNTIKLQPKIVIIDRNNESIPEGAIRFSEIAEQSSIDSSLLNKITIDKEDLAFLPFSSGTSGLSKGVEITYKNTLAALEIMTNEEICLPKLTNDTYQDVVPCILPFFHIYGLVVNLMGHLANGCKLMTMTKFAPDIYLDLLKKERASLLYVVPPIAIFLGKSPAVTSEHLESVRFMLSGAAPLAASDADLLLEKSKGKLEFIQAYGSTESTSVCTSMIIGSEKDYSAVGVPVSNTEIKFAHPDTGVIVPPDQEGELLIRGPQVMRGYLNNEQATKESFTEDGFYKTGDLGFFDSKKGLHITERIKELIKVKGLQVAPAELESLLRTHPAVQEAAVIGIPHEIYGEVPKAFILTKPSAKVQAQELQEYVASKVASYKKIEVFQFVDSIPKTASGKILRRELKNA